MSAPRFGSCAITTWVNQTATPDEAEVLQCIGHRGGNALENLVAARYLPPRDVLSVGLTLLSALARLCQSDSASSILQRAAWPNKS